MLNFEFRLNLTNTQGSVSFVLCSHDPIFRTNKESSIWRQTITGISCKIRRRLLSFKNSVGWKYSMFYFPFFPKYGSVCPKVISMCSRDPIFGTNKNRILKKGSCERAFKPNFHSHLSPVANAVFFGEKFLCGKVDLHFLSRISIQACRLSLAKFSSETRKTIQTPNVCP